METLISVAFITLYSMLIARIWGRHMYRVGRAHGEQYARRRVWEEAALAAEGDHGSEVVKVIYPEPDEDGGTVYYMPSVHH